MSIFFLDAIVKILQQSLFEEVDFAAAKMVLHAYNNAAGSAAIAFLSPLAMLADYTAMYFLSQIFIRTFWLNRYSLFQQIIISISL